VSSATCHGALTVDFRACCSSCTMTNSFVSNNNNNNPICKVPECLKTSVAQYWWKELWVVDICISWSRRLHNTWIAGSQIYSKSVLKWNCWKSRGHVPQCPIAGDATAFQPDHDVFPGIVSWLSSSCSPVWLSMWIDKVQEIKDPKHPLHYVLPPVKLSNSQMVLRPTYPYQLPLNKSSRYGRDFIPYSIAKKF